MQPPGEVLEHDDREIWRQAVLPWIAEQQRSVWSRYEELRGSDRTTCEPREVLPAAILRY